MRPTLALSLILVSVMAACLGPSATDGTLRLEPRQLAVDEVERRMFGQVRLLGVYQLKSGDRSFGALSGLAFDGRMMTAISDTGLWVRFPLEVDEDGAPLSLGNLELGPLGGLDGSSSDYDAEEVVALPEGWLISFEHRHRLMLYPHDLSASPRRLEAPAEFPRQPANGGGEAVTQLDDGRLLILSEEGGPGELGWGWLGRPGQWERLSYRRHGKFRPTSARQLANGDILVSERRFSLLGGFSLRLVLVPADQIKTGAVLDGRELMVLEPPLLVDNYEGLAVRRRADGRTVAYLVSDDNFNPLQATLLMALLLPE